jgi:hypothetical protein
MKSLGKVLLISALGIGAVVLIAWVAKGEELTPAGSAKTDVSPSTVTAADLPTPGDSTVTLPTGQSYDMTQDPIPALRYSVPYSGPVLTASDQLRAATVVAGRELVAKEIIPVVQNLKPEEQKFAILSASPNTLSSYLGVVKGTTTVTPTNNTVKLGDAPGAAARASAEAAARGIKAIPSTGKYKPATSSKKK